MIKWKIDHGSRNEDYSLLKLRWNSHFPPPRALQTIHYLDSQYRHLPLDLLNIITDSQGHRIIEKLNLTQEHVARPAEVAP